MEAMAISRSGLDVEWQRIQVIAANIANINTTRTANGSPYSAQRLISGPAADFSQHLTGASGNQPVGSDRGVMVYQVITTANGTRQVFDPDHPHADENGFVTYPAISQAEEMSMLVKTQRAYEANLVALSAAQRMYSSALQVGRQS
jgi:flagellar basal-body rod protein FlgC